MEKNNSEKESQTGQQQQQQQQIQQKQQQPQQSQQKQQQTIRGQNPNQITGNKKGKASPPIIKIYNIEVKDITDKIKNLLKNDLFSIKIVNRDIVNLSLNSNEDHQTVKNFLKGQQISFFTYTPSEMKPYSVIIKGLSSSYEVGDLEDHIKSLDADLTVNRVIKFNGDRWLVQLSHDSDVAAVFSMKYILHCKVTVEKFKQGGIIQCRNCQRFGHIATNCSMTYRCVKCGLVHGPGKCQIPRKELNTEVFVRKDPITGVVERRIGLPVRCVNCDKEGHVASAKNCPKRLEIKRRLDERRANRAQVNSVPIRLTTQFRTANRSYAGVVDGTRGNMSFQSTGGKNVMARVNFVFNTLNSDCSRLLGADFMTCFSKVKKFAGPIARIQNDEEKTRAIVGLLMSLAIDG